MLKCTAAVKDRCLLTLKIVVVDREQLLISSAYKISLHNSSSYEVVIVPLLMSEDIQVILKRG